MAHFCERRSCGSVSIASASTNRFVYINHRRDCLCVSQVVETPSMCVTSLRHFVYIRASVRGLFTMDRNHFVM